MIAYLILALAIGQTGDASMELFDCHWLFHRGDVNGGESPDLDDSDWRDLDLPHDWSIEGPFIHNIPGDEEFDQFAAKWFDIPPGESLVASLAGYRPGGIGWYRKPFTLPRGSLGKQVLIQFDGVYMDADVWINGRHLGNHPYGYTSFYYDLTPYLHFGRANNLLAVRVNVQQPCSRWYTGVGIYRHVWLSVNEPLHIAHWGITVSTPEATEEAAVVRLGTRVENKLKRKAAIALETTILDEAGAHAATLSNSAEIDADSTLVITQSFHIPDPQLWSNHAPHLYRAISLLSDGDDVLDSQTTPFGIRSFEFTKDRGFLLNGQRVPLKGVNMHHDQGCIGAVAYERAMERQLEILKKMGCNAIRTAHNPPAPAFLDLCDRMGFLVIEEAFDEWKENKMRYGYGRFFDEWSERDLVSMIRRDRNHPCVIAWSIGNEISEQESAGGCAMAKRLADICRREDPTRPVTAGCDKVERALETGFAEPLDVIGINQSFASHDLLRDKTPTVASESAYLMTTRGEYNLVIEKGRPVIKPQLGHVYTAYDLGILTLKDMILGVTSEAAIQAFKDRPWVAGEFVWSGFDYLGEPVPFQWPSRSSYYGIIDFCGFPKDRYYLYQSQWTDAPMLHILPHWNWKGYEGLDIPVWCFTNCESVELFLNGKSCGARETGRNESLHLEWTVPYEQGALRAIGKRNGAVVCTEEMHTAGAPARIELLADRIRLQPSGQDLAYVTARIVDKDGYLCPNADNSLQFEAEGEGVLLGIGNGDPTSLEEFSGNKMNAFHGLCLAVLKGSRKSGQLKLTAASKGLNPASVVVTVERSPA